MAQRNGAGDLRGDLFHRLVGAEHRGNDGQIVPHADTAVRPPETHEFHLFAPLTFPLSQPMLWLWIQLPAGTSSSM